MRCVRRGFTLIELLVVIAIVAILAAILFPILARVRERSLASACSANLKQFGVAFALYAHDHDGRLPSPGGTGVSERGVWRDTETSAISAYISGGPHRRNDAPGIWACPAYLARVGQRTGDYAVESYGMNSCLRGRPDTPFPKSMGVKGGLPLDRVRDPGGTILLYEARWFVTEDSRYGRTDRCGDFGLVQGYARTEDEATRRDPGRSWGPPMHQGRNNYLWADGHVTLMRPEQRGDDPAFDTRYPPREPGRNYWYVEKAYYQRTGQPLNP